MGLLKKKPDLISQKAQSLSAQIAALEAEIQRLDSQLKQGHEPAAGAGQPRLRSTAVPLGAAVPHATLPPAPLAPAEPIFEGDGQEQLKSKVETPTTPQHFNELGVRKYDLAATFQRLRNHLHGPPTANPKLVNLLAAGSVQGLRPLRYEKRVARNRVIALVAFLFVILLGILAVFLRRNH